MTLLTLAMIRSLIREDPSVVEDALGTRRRPEAKA
jgi:hypothetical protein